VFDPRTAELLQSAPGVPGLEADDLPKALTKAYARLVSDRLEGGDGDLEIDIDDPWSVDRIADTYEIIASLEQDASLRRAAAFVAGTAQQSSRGVSPPRTAWSSSPSIATASMHRWRPRCCS
jgi:hypothetical protein